MHLDLTSERQNKMAAINKWIGIGNLGRDPETRYSAGGEAMCSFSIAISDKWKDKATGEQKEHTEWVNISAFGKLAEICGQYLKKGSSVYIEGKMRTRKYTDKDGIERYATSINADTMQMLGGRGDSQEGQQSAKPAARPAQQAAPQADFDGDDIPF